MSNLGPKHRTHRDQSHTEAAPLLVNRPESRHARIRGVFIVTALFYARTMIHLYSGRNVYHFEALPFLNHFHVVASFVSILMTGFWSHMSYLRGREKVLAISATSILVVNAYLAIIAYYHQTKEVVVLLSVVGSAVESLFGGLPMMNAIAYSYIADGSQHDRRAVRFCILEATKMLALFSLYEFLPMFTFGISPKAILYVPFMFAALISAVILAFVSRLEESPTHHLVRTSSWVEDVKDSFRTLFSQATVLTRSYTTNREVTFIGLSVFIYSFVLSIYDGELESREVAVSVRKLVPIIRFASYVAIIPTILFFNRERNRSQERATSEITISKNIVYFQIVCAMIALVIPTSFDYILVGVYLPTLVSGFMPLLYTIGSVYYGGEHGATIELYSALTVAQSLGEWLPSVYGLVSEASKNSSYTIELVHVACLVAVALLLLFSQAPEETIIHAANNGE